MKERKQTNPYTGSCSVYGDLLRVLAKYLKKMGIHVLDPDYEVFNRHLLVFFAIATLYSIMVLTAIHTAEGHFVNTVKSLTTFGIFIQAIAKSLTFGKSARDICILTRLFHEIYERNMSDPQLKLILDRHVGYLWPLFYATQTVYSASVASISILPCLFSLAIRSPYYSLDLFFPSVDETTWSGFIVTYLFLFVGSYFWVPTLIASDVLYFSQLILAASHLQTMIHLLDKVDACTEDETHVQEKESEITRLLHRVCFEHQQHLQ